MKKVELKILEELVKFQNYLLDSGIIVLTAFISPFKSDRDLVRSLFKEGHF